MKKKHVQRVDLGEKRSTKKTKTDRGTPDKNRKVVVEVYNKFYRDQVSALYRAVARDK